MGLTHTQVCQLDAYYTDMHWYPLSSKRNQSGGTDVFAVGCTNGKFLGKPTGTHMCLVLLAHFSWLYHFAYVHTATQN